MKPQQLRYLVAVAENGSLSQAARYLGIAQPALSQQIQAIEGELSVQLFDRTVRGTIPTAAGTVMIEHAYSLLERMDQATRDVQRLSHDVTGDVSIVLTSFGIADRIMPDLVRSLHLRYPKVRITARLVASREANAALANGDYDLGIIPADEKVGSINARHFASQAYYLFQAGKVPQGSQTSADEAITLREAAKLDLVTLRPGDPFQEALVAEASRQSVPIASKYEATSLVMMHGFVESGIAAAIIPWLAGRDKVLLGRMTARKIVDPSFHLDYLLAWPKQRPLHLAAERVANLLSEIGHTL